MNMNSRESQLQAFSRLLDIMDDLREKCPWDKQQTMESLRHLTIEETYELSEAILNQDMPEIRKELGDLILHIVFYAKILLRYCMVFVINWCAATHISMPIWR
jgi:XTP/dITP diphosphohydrolase